MLYYSTNRQSPSVTFREAALQGQPLDKGLFFPEKITVFADSLLTKSKAEIAFETIRPYVGETIPDETLYRICEETIDFDFPLVKVTEDIYSLELFHGPTLAFKDVGARFMSRCLGYFARDFKNKIVVLVATSGDTGGAVANGFYGVEGVDVVILYPSGKVSRVQELQLTTLGKNITALEVNGTFDDCQRLVKQALADADILEKVFLTSANSINVARWLPQKFYYYFALKQWNERDAPVVCVPSGNFGNICSGLLAKTEGLQTKNFIAACNANDVFPRYLQNGNYQPKQSVATLSNAMDVGNPSNFVRVLEIFANDFPQLKNVVSSLSVDDETTSETIREVIEKYNYLLDPHGAVGFHALQNYLREHEGEKGFFLATAHPVKFDSVEKIVRKKTEVPDSIKELLTRQKESVKVENDYDSVKETILSI